MNFVSAVQCPTDFTVHWIKVEKFTISDNSDTVVKQVTKEQCFNYCLVLLANSFSNMFKKKNNS